MNVVRCALLVPLLAVVALSGCRTRGDTKSVEQDELNADNQRLTAQVGKLTEENRALEQRLKNAQDELEKARSAPTIGQKFGKMLATGEDIEGTVKTEGGGLALNEDFAFAKGSADLSPEGKKSIEKIAARLNQGEYAGSMVIIEGHTDDSPVARASTKEKYTDNWGLSGARAASVIRALESAGVGAKRLKGQFRGDTQPRGADKAANRRVEIYLGG